MITTSPTVHFAIKLLFTCSLLRHKISFETKSPYDFHRPQYRRNYTRTDFYSAFIFSLFYTVISKKSYDKKSHQRSPQKRNEIRCKTENSGSLRLPQLHTAITPDKRNSKQPLPIRIARAKVGTKNPTQDET